MRRSIPISLVGAFAIVAFSISAVAGRAPSGDALEATGSFRSYRANRQAFMWTRNEATSSSTEWMQLGMSGPIRSRGAASGTISINAGGAPVEVRLMWDNGHVFRPEAALFNPSESLESFSFGFVSDHDRPSGCHYFHAEWRSPTGTEATIYDANVVLDYRSAPATDEAFCE
jgi:hypothetical protein